MWIWCCFLLLGQGARNLSFRRFSLRRPASRFLLEEGLELVFFVALWYFSTTKQRPLVIAAVSSLLAAANAPFQTDYQSLETCRRIFTPAEVFLTLFSCFIRSQ
jgi:hypothetical protein